ncbi:uncharacterized protein [Oscarella lobularis]|uniref:uncharacterized protein isoform X2 n=1 Tax=Oscarella lobularis TaxID=121494 RepID=UPI0033144E8E
MLPAWLSIALIAAVSRGGEPETQFAGNRERCITRYYDLSYEHPNSFLSIPLQPFPFNGNRLRASVLLKLYEADVCCPPTRGCRSPCDQVQSVLYVVDLTLALVSIGVRSAQCERGKKAFSNEPKDDVIGSNTTNVLGTFPKWEVFSNAYVSFSLFVRSIISPETEGNFSPTSTSAIRNSIICFFAMFLLLVVIIGATSFFCEKNRFSECHYRHKISSVCSSSMINETNYGVHFPINDFRFLVFMFFVVAVVVPQSVLSADGFKLGPDCEDCGGRDWYCSPSTCLQFPEYKTSFAKAAESYSRVGAALLSIESKKEENDILNILDELYQGFADTITLFFGLTRAPSSENGVYSYRWLDGSPFIYAHWNYLDPRIGNGLCEKIVYSSFNNKPSTMQWGAYSCLSHNHFICKKPRETSRRDGDFRLVGGVMPAQGRLEIYHGALWRRVCMLNASYNARHAADIACQKLGYSGLLEASSHISDSDVVSCKIHCASKPITVCSCDKGNATCDENIFVSCRSGTVQSIDVRLASDSVPSQGLLEIRVGGQWEVACFASNNTNFGRLSKPFCKHQGYDNGTLSFLSLSSSTLLSRNACWRVSCQSRNCTALKKMDSLHAVSRLLLLTSKIKFYSAVELTCQMSDWSVRLVNTVAEAHISWGKVEVYLNKTWSVVCDREWDLAASDVVCRQLGYGNAIEQRVQASLTDAGIRIYSNGTRCKGNETSLKDCDYISTHTQRNQSCSEVMVTCEERKYCPSGWFLYAGYCYTLTEFPRDFGDIRWDLDRRRCGRGLLSISSSHEHAFALALLADFDDKNEFTVEEDVWIGLQREADTSFTWINGDNISYSMWDIGEPYVSPRRKCVAMDSRTGYWKTADCRVHKKALCKIARVDFDNEIRQASPPSSSDWCRKNEVYFKKACYHFSKDVDESVSQEFAHRNACQQLYDADLASLSSISEYFFIAKEFSPSKSAYWIGLIRNDTSDSFTWLLGSYPTFTKWAKYEPTHGKGDCVTFGFDGLDFGWSVANCSAKAGYICKRQLNDSTDMATALNQTAPSYVYMCPSGWTKLGMQSCFKRLEILTTWHESLAECEKLAEGYVSLSSINSRQEMNQLSTMLDENETWIGLNDLDNEGIYTWTDGSPLVYEIGGLSEYEESVWEREAHDCVASTRATWLPRNCSERKKSVCRTPAILDFDECLRTRCDANATCENTLSSYKCTCKPGFTGNGTTCSISAKDSTSLQLIIIIAAIFSILVFLFFIAFCIICRRKHRLARTAFDEWEISRGDLHVLEKIGEGFFGIVHKAYLYHHALKQQKMRSELKRDFGNDDYKSAVACKMLKGTFLQSDDAEAVLVDEIKLMKRIGQHPHVVGILASITISRPFCLIVEYCCHGNLLNYLRKGRPLSSCVSGETNESVQDLDDDNPGQGEKDSKVLADDVDKKNKDNLSEKEVKVEEKRAVLELTASDLLSFAWQISSGMEYLAGKGLVHRDLACRNVLVCENNLVKVSDFGLTRAIYDNGAYRQRTNRRLPLRWMSIEAIIHRIFTEKSDVWSFGVVLWEIFTFGCFPYPCKSSREFMLLLRRGDRLNCPENCSKELYHLMSECWYAEPVNRPSFQELSHQLGTMIEEESPNRYLNLDVTCLYPLWDLRTLTETRESESGSSENTDDPFEVKTITPNETDSERVGVSQHVSTL